PTDEVLIEESVLGWKECEMEVVRDKKDNCIIICSIENLDPIGVHTGDSITVAPALTLTDKEYQTMRDATLAVLRKIGVDPGASTTLITSMKSVGEVMAIGRTFQESLQKALRGLETGLTGLDEIEIEGLGRSDDKNAIRAALGTPTPNRILQVAQAMRLGWSDEDIFNSCKIDPWFLSEMRGIVDMELKIKAKGLPPNGYGMRMLKAMGFSDARLAVLSESTEAEITAKRHALGVRPVFKRIDTCAAEFASPTAYIYSTYESPFAGHVADESAPSDAKKVIILGGGPNRIGQGIEFDYCCCHACFALHDAGYETIMINCNP